MLHMWWEWLPEGFVCGYFCWGTLQASWGDSREFSLRWLTTAAIPMERKKEDKVSTFGNMIFWSRPRGLGDLLQGNGMMPSSHEIPSSLPLVVSWRRRSLWFRLVEHGESKTE